MAGTGVLHLADGVHATWAAFTTFAAHSFDATVWDQHGQDLASLADEGTSAVFGLTAAQARHVAALAGLSRRQRRATAVGFVDV